LDIKLTLKEKNMTNGEKETLIKLINKSLRSVNRLKFKYAGHARNFAEAMYLKHVSDNIDADLHDLFDIDKELLIARIDKKINHLKNIIEKVENL
tara:strand:- start:91 stop:375 length:285 start_codon:yes stop_codon:yes gene_type:complete